MILAAAVAIGLAVAIAVILLALERPWLGLRLAGEESGVGIVVKQAEGPAASIAEGLAIVEITDGLDTMVLEPLDVVSEPDGTMGTFSAYRRFLERQERLSRIQGAEKITLTATDGTEHTLRPVQEGRPVGSLPAEFWVQVFVGVAAWLVSASVFAFRAREISVRYLLVSGAATLLFASLAAVYSTRELAMPASLFRWLNDLNFFGGSLFAGSFVAMLLHYPKRIAPVGVGAGILLLYVVWFGMQQMGAFDSMTFARRFLVVAGVISTFFLAGIHWIRTKTDPVARAALQWFLLSWMVGTMAFMFFILLPQMFGVDTSPLQGYAFLLFLLVYGGLAFGILRFRLFELGDWWRRIVVWAITILLLVVLDIIFVIGLHLSSELALSLTLLLCGLFWIPIRSLMWSRVAVRRKIQPEDFLGKVMETVFSPLENISQAERWERLLRDAFDPLHVQREQEEISEVRMTRDGLWLSLPGVGPAPALRLGFAEGGRRLFSPRDAILATKLTTMLEQAIESKAAYEKGVAEERGRIARDMHDTVGAQLLAALHRRDPEEKDATIREVMAEVRTIINNSSRNGNTLGDGLAELRWETNERLANVGISLDWANEIEDFPPMAYKSLHALRAVIREAVSNIVRHAEAKNVRIAFRHSPGKTVVEISDDGKGIEQSNYHHGNGLKNMQKRLEELGGEFRCATHGKGVSLMIQLPCDSEDPMRR